MPRKHDLIRWSAAIFLTVSAILLFYDTLFGQRVLLKILSKILVVTQPLLIGAFLAYLLSPLINLFESHFFPGQLKKAAEQGQMSVRWVRAISLLFTWVIIGLLCYLLASVLLPELYRSVLQLISNVELYYNTLIRWIREILDSNAGLENWVTLQVDKYYHNAIDWLSTEALPRAQTLVSALSGGVVSAMDFLMDLLVGLIVSVYFLATKERCAAHTRKMIYGLFSRENVYWILRGARKVDRVFAGFVRGKLLDSLIIGILCFIGCSALKMPYTSLVSVVVGVTNVIPFFGPFLGAIPSTFLILLVSPIKAVYFVAFVLALQQLDGNVIGPKILGESTGLSSLWVIAAILVGGGFFGFLGMFFGVPVFACLYSAATFFIEHRLRKKGLPVESETYIRDLPEEGRKRPE